MSATTADLGLLPDDARLRPRLWIGSTATARVQFRGPDRRPIAATGPVVFTWRGANVVVPLAGSAVAGAVGLYECRYQPPTTGEWAVRASDSGAENPLDWVAFDVAAEPPRGPVPDQALWLTVEGDALVSTQGMHLAGVTIADLDVTATLAAGDKLPLAREGETLVIDGADVLAASMGRVTATGTLVAGVVTGEIGGVSITSTLTGSTITDVYGPPVSETWRTTLSGGTITRERIA